jgi:hypothetical protein
MRQVRQRRLLSMFLHFIRSRIYFIYLGYLVLNMSVQTICLILPCEPIRVIIGELSVI